MMIIAMFLYQDEMIASIGAWVAIAQLLCMFSMIPLLFGFFGEMEKIRKDPNHKFGSETWTAKPHEIQDLIGLKPDMRRTMQAPPGPPPPPGR